MRKLAVHLPRHVVAAVVGLCALNIIGPWPTYAGQGPPTLPIAATVKVGRFPTALAVDERLGRVFVVNMLSQTMSELDAVRGVVVRTIPLAPQQESIAIDSQNHHAFLTSIGGGERRTAGRWGRWCGVSYHDR